MIFFVLVVVAAVVAALVADCTVFVSLMIQLLPVSLSFTQRR